MTFPSWSALDPEPMRDENGTPEPCERRHFTEPDAWCEYPAAEITASGQAVCAEHLDADLTRLD